MKEYGRMMRDKKKEQIIIMSLWKLKKHKKLSTKNKK